MDHNFWYFYLLSDSTVDFDVPEPAASAMDFDAPDPEPEMETVEADSDSADFMCTDYSVPVKEEDVANENISRYQAG